MAPKKKTDEKPASQAATKAERTGTSSRTPAEMKRLLRQEEVFRKRIIERRTVRAVAEEMGLCLQTVIDDCKAELQRRADELADRRETEKVEQLSMVEDLYLQSLAMREVPGSGALGAAGKALEMRARILGLDAPTKVDVGLQKLFAAFDDEE